mgnify:CR=1 FL=1
MTMKRHVIAGWILCVAAAVPLWAQESVDLILHNGKIFTADQLLSTFSAVAVRDDRIVALGWDGLLDQYRAVRTVDLDVLLDVTVRLKELGAEPEKLSAEDLAELPDLGSAFNDQLAWRALVAELTPK